MNMLPTSNSDITKGVRLQLEAVAVDYGTTGRALENVSLDIRPREFVGVVGPSGCGKSTLLRVMAGLQRPTSGIVRLNGAAIEVPSRVVGMVFQNSTLFPWLTIEQNVAFALRSRRASDEAGAYLDRVGLASVGASFPAALSGGMTQRACLARALAAAPGVLLMDEPFSSLDAISRSGMHEVLLSTWSDSCMSVVLVTHDIDEAVALADRVIILGPKPAKVMGMVEVSLPRPRTSRGVHCTGFQETRNHIARSSGMF